MAAKFFTFAAICLFSAAQGNNEAKYLGQKINLHAADGTSSELEVMKEAFIRSEEVRQQSMAVIQQTMTSSSALTLLQKSHKDSPQLRYLVSLVQGKQGSLRKQSPVDNSVTGAREMLNTMIYEAMEKYDGEVTKCTDFYYHHCADLAESRGIIAASNKLAANARTHYLASESEKGNCERDIEINSQDLNHTKMQCEHELTVMRNRLQVLDGDIEVIGNISAGLEDCPEATKLIQEDQYQIMYCTDKCTKKNYFALKHKGLHEKLNQLQSSASLELMRGTFADMVHGSPKQLIEVSSHRKNDSVSTSLMPPSIDYSDPVQELEVPGDPCDGPPEKPVGSDACTLGAGTCEILQERFMAIMGALEAEAQELKQNIESRKMMCEERVETLEDEIALDRQRKEDAETKLSESTAEEATASENGRLANGDFEKLDKELKDEMERCQDSYLASEGEICALKKIRGEVYKLKADGVAPAIQDCELGKWTESECSVECGGPGYQTLTRTAEVPPDAEGVQCLPKQANRTCGYMPCPVNCETSVWSEWSKCSARCGGGTKSRMKDILTAPKHDGTPCENVEESDSCGTGACEKDCELHDWDEWSPCSKDCNGGTKKRRREIKESPEGAGECPDEESPKREEFMMCHTQGCGVWADGLVHCFAPLEITLLLDASSSMKKKGWNLEITAAKSLVSAFEGSSVTGASIGAIVYSGPKSWNKYKKCMKGNKSEEWKITNCKVETLIDRTTDLSQVKEALSNAVFLRGTTFTSGALNAAAAKFANSDVSDSHRIVVVFTDGVPLSKEDTAFSSHEVAEHARLLWVPIGTKAPIDEIQKWASEPFFENIESAEDVEDLEKPALVNDIIADICPSGTSR